MSSPRDPVSQFDAFQAPETPSDTSLSDTSLAETPPAETPPQETPSQEALPEAPPETALKAPQLELSRQVQVCQNRTCLRSQSDKVLALLLAKAPDDVIVIGCGCLGQCGAGPIVHVTPDNIWYCRVATKADVLEIVEQHLTQGKPLRRLLHPRIHAYYPSE